MIAVDSNVLVLSLKGAEDPAVSLMREALAEDSLVLPPPVVTEVLSFVGAAGIAAVIESYRRLPLDVGFWERAAETRRRVLSLGLRARLGDALIAQFCIDSDVPLITNDQDFRHFATHCGLKLST